MLRELLVVSSVAQLEVTEWERRRVRRSGGRAEAMVLRCKYLQPALKAFRLAANPKLH